MRATVRGGQSAAATTVLASGAPETTVYLLERGRDGDTTALNELFNRQVRALKRWASGRLPRWARDGADTQDLVQETALHTFARLHTFTPRNTGSLQAYLRQGVANRIRNEFRRARRHPHATAPDEELPADLTSPLAAVIRSEQQRHYERALARLTSAERELLIGRLDLGLSYDELALKTGRPSGNAARAAVGRALLRLARTIPSD